MNLLIVMIVLLWGINSLSCLMGYEGDWSSASPWEMIVMVLLFMVFGPFIMLANIVVGLADIITGNDDNDKMLKE